MTDVGERSHEIGESQRALEVELDDVVTTRVRIVIDAVYPGERWSDVRISEVRVYGR